MGATKPNRTNVEHGYSNPTTNESMGEDSPPKTPEQLDREPTQANGREWDEEDLEGVPSKNDLLVDETEDRE